MKLKLFSRQSLRAGNYGGATKKMKVGGVRL